MTSRDEQIEPSVHGVVVHVSMPLVALLVAVLLLGAGCADRGRPVVVEKTGQRQPVQVVRDGDARTIGKTPSPRERGVYVVAKGDTLYRIAWRFGSTVEALARGNGLKPPYTIFPGQRLRVITTHRAAVAGGKSDDEGISVAPRNTELPAGPVPWTWPVHAAPVREFGRGNKGLDFELAPRTTVRAAGTGVVVYSGVGLGGYEGLLILRHAEGFLSAYSLNCAVRPKEGDVLKGGDPIADITGSGRAARFHFEIRKDGDPVGPRTLLK
jgi:lipoprotein NlpD